MVPVNVVNVKLADMDWDETTLLARVLPMDFIWVLVLNDVTLIDCPAPIPATNGSGLVSEFDLGVTTD